MNEDDLKLSPLGDEQKLTEQFRKVKELMDSLATASKSVADEAKKLNEAIVGIDTKNLKYASDKLNEIFDLSSKKGLEGIRGLQKEAEALFEYVKNGTFSEDNSFSIKEEDFNRLKESSKEMDEFAKQIGKMQSEGDKLEPAFARLGIGIKKAFTAGNDAAKLTEGLADISAGLGTAMEVSKKFAGAISAIGDLTRVKALKGIGNVVTQTVNTAEETLKGAQSGMALGTQIGAAFGPMGAAIGAGVSLVTSLGKMFGANRANRLKLRKEADAKALTAEIAELNINRIYRERYEWSKKIGESNLAHIARQGQELKSQAEENELLQKNLLEKLQGTKFKESEEFKKTGLFGWGKGKIVVNWEQIGDKSWKEIETLANSGKLSEEAQKYYEALKAAREEGKALADREVQYLENVRQELTGTTYDSLVSSIVDGFKAGKQSAADFADTFEKLMKTAVAASLQRFVDDSMRGWYEEWSALSENGLTEDEIAYLQRKYNDIIDSTARKKEELEEITGVGVSDSGGNSPRSSSGGFGSMSQDTADELNGRFSALQMSAINLEQSSLVRNEQLSAIGLDTSLMRTNLSLLTFSIDEIKEINRVSMNHLYKIEKNTALLRETNSLLTKVATHTARL